MEKQIKVVKIIDDKSLVINAGSNDFLKKGRIVEVYQPGEEVIDPESGESLGALDYLKATLEVTNVMPKMAECKNIVVQQIDQLHVLNPFSVVERATAKTINVDPRDISGGFEGIDRKIRVGDLVRIVSN